jgi:hypothetical protein
MEAVVQLDAVQNHSRPLNLVKMLCSKGCNPNAVDGLDTRNTALHLAAQVRPCLFI